MLNPNVEIKKWFISNLDIGTPVYDGFAPDLAPNEYIVMTGRTSSQEQGKNGYTNNCTIILDIVTKSANFGYKRSEEISNFILTDINSDTIINLGTGWDASSLSIESIRNLDGLSPLDNIFRTIITYNLTITQN